MRRGHWCEWLACLKLDAIQELMNACIDEWMDEWMNE